MNNQHTNKWTVRQVTKIDGVGVMWSSDGQSFDGVFEGIGGLKRTLLLGFCSSGRLLPAGRRVCVIDRVQCQRATM